VVAISNHPIAGGIGINLLQLRRGVQAAIDFDIAQGSRSSGLDDFGLSDNIFKLSLFRGGWVW